MPGVMPEVAGMPLEPVPGMWIEFEHAEGIERAEVTWARCSRRGEWVVRTTSPNAPVLDWSVPRIFAIHEGGTRIWRRPPGLPSSEKGVQSASKSHG